MEVFNSLMKSESSGKDSIVSEKKEVEKLVQKVTSAPKKFEKKPTYRLFSQNHFFENYKNENEKKNIENVKMMESVYIAACEKMT